MSRALKNATADWALQTWQCQSSQHGSGWVACSCEMQASGRARLDKLIPNMCGILCRTSIVFRRLLLVYVAQNLLK